jgi:hypothetical protein
MLLDWEIAILKPTEQNYIPMIYDLKIFPEPVLSNSGYSGALE